MTDDAGKTSETEVEEEKKPEAEAKPEEKPNDIKAMESALKKANREAEAARKKLKEIEDAGKSETDKLRDEAAAAKKDAADARKEALKLKVGLEKGLPKSLVSRLQGDTEEEMSADADVLLTELKPKAPSGDADGGKRGETPDPSKDMDQVLRAAVAGARK